MLSHTGEKRTWHVLYSPTRPCYSFQFSHSSCLSPALSTHFTSPPIYQRTHVPNVTGASPRPQMPSGIRRRATLVHILIQNPWGQPARRPAASGHGPERQRVSTLSLRTNVHSLWLNLGVLVCNSQTGNRMQGILTRKIFLRMITAPGRAPKMLMARLILGLIRVLSTAHRQVHPRLPVQILMAQWYGPDRRRPPLMHHTTKSPP